MTVATPSATRAATGQTPVSIFVVDGVEIRFFGGKAAKIFKILIFWKKTAPRHLRDIFATTARQLRDNCATLRDISATSPRQLASKTGKMAEKSLCDLSRASWYGDGGDGDPTPTRKHKRRSAIAEKVGLWSSGGLIWAVRHWIFKSFCNFACDYPIHHFPSKKTWQNRNDPTN